MMLYPTFISLGSCGLLKEKIYVFVFMVSSFLLIEIRFTSVTPCCCRYDLISSKVQRDSSELRTTPFDVFRDKYAYDLILRPPKVFILSRLSAKVLLSTFTSIVPLFNVFTDVGLTIPERVFSTKIGLSFERGLSSKDSRTIKCGKVEGCISVSESLSEYERLKDFGVAINIKKYSSGVLPTNPGALQGDVLRGKPIRLSNTRATHLRYSSLRMFRIKYKKNVKHKEANKAKTIVKV